MRKISLKKKNLARGPGKRKNSINELTQDFKELRVDKTPLKKVMFHLVPEEENIHVLKNWCKNELPKLFTLDKLEVKVVTDTRVLIEFEANDISEIVYQISLLGKGVLGYIFRVENENYF